MALSALSLCEQEAYTPYEHLYRSLFLSTDDLFLMLTAYFDDSGTSQADPVYVVAGYLSTVQMWDVFNERWSNLLFQNGVKQMHRADLETLQGEFKNWTPARRTEFLKKAHAIIRRCTFLPLGLAVIKADYEDVIPADHKTRRYGLYSWCVEGCLAALGMWCDKHHRRREPINLVFEAGTRGRNQVEQIFRLLDKYPTSHPDACEVGTWAFAKKNVLPLQAADVIAYELFKFIKNEAVDRRKRKIRYSALDLFRDTDTSLLKYFDRKTFESILKMHGPGWDI